MKRLFAILAALLAVLLTLPAGAQQKSVPIVSIAPQSSSNARADGALLPKVFAGWEMSGTSEISKDAAAADPTNGAALREYGLEEFASATYTKEPGRKLQVKAIRFRDASGAYGAFTFYKLPEMLNEKFGDQGASMNERVLFYHGNVLVQATFDRITVMSAAELRELADALPVAKGPAANLPTLPAYLPKQAYVTNSAKYVLGPAGLQQVEAPLSSDLVDFGRDAEVALGHYRTSAGTATMMLVAYPTPQIAAERLRAIEAAHPNTGGNTFDQFVSKRTGPIVAVISGKVPISEAKSLLASVNYDADVTWNQATSLNKKDNIGNLIMQNFLLIAIIFGFAIVMGFAFGGFRLLMKRWFPDRVFDRDLDIIRLNLK